MSGYSFHPEAFTDIDQLWDYIAEDNIDAADLIQVRPLGIAHRHVT